MNGLNFIMVRCNVSVKEVSDILGVSQQEIDLWKNGKQPVPEEQKSQLAEYFGIGKEYFGEISEEQKQVLLEKAMFRYFKDEKEYYTYKPCLEGDRNRMIVCFPEEREISLDEEYVQVEKQLKSTLEKASDIIRDHDRGRGIMDKVGAIRRGCKLYDAFNQIMDEKSKQEPGNRVMYYDEIKSIVQAILLAQNLMSVEELPEEHPELEYLGKREWTISLAKLFSEHWNEQKKLSREHLDAQKAEIKQREKNDRHERTDDSTEPTQDLNEIIVKLEEKNREIRQSGQESGRKGSWFFPVHVSEQ
ncbi:MAG: helix-turn-helix transcriptional regulator [Clostridiales bacterium]|nr:helix-turn-helix transcriptional regulator [Clostridiales bacterium]